MSRTQADRGFSEYCNKLELSTDVLEQLNVSHWILIFVGHTPFARQGRMYKGHEKANWFWKRYEQHVEGSWLHNNEEVHMAVREWLRTQQLVVCAEKEDKLAEKYGLRLKH